MDRTLVIILLCLQLGVILAKKNMKSQTCTPSCTCDEGDADSATVTKHEGLAAAVGAMTPLLMGGAGLGLYRVLRGMGPGGSGPGAPSASPKLSPPSTKQPSFPTFRDSPSSYRSTRRGSTPLSMFGEDDEISFDESWRSPRPDTTSTYTNIHKAHKADSVNRWM